MIRPMNATDAFALADLDAVDQAGLVAAGEMSATELLEAAIVRLEATRELNAVIADLFDRGRQQAAALDASGVVRNGQSSRFAGFRSCSRILGRRSLERRRRWARARCAPTSRP